MCPGCSGFACQECFSQWIINKKKECPICRRSLQLNQVIKCRFLEDFSQCLENYVQQSEEQVSKNFKNKEDFCLEHKLQMIYFCIPCKKLVCSDCVMFTENHKGHKCERLKIIYE